MATLDLGYGEKDIIFLGMERPGFVGIFSMDSEMNIEVESFHYNGGSGDTWGNLWEDHSIWDLDVEDIK